MREYYSLESISENIAKIETPNGEFIRIAAAELPPNAKAGDLLYREENTFKIDTEETKNRKTLLFNMQNSLFNKKNK